MSPQRTVISTDAGLFGAYRLGPAALARLQDWLSARAATRLAGDDSLQLWQLGQPRGPLAYAVVGGVQVWLLGQLYPAAAADAPTAATRIAAAWANAGAAALWSLVGQFALVLWDAGRSQLALYRDPSAARTLYYRCDPDGALLFSDRLDLLVDNPLGVRRLARSAWHEYLRFLDISTPATTWAEVYSTEPGQLLLQDRGGLHRHDPPPVPSLAPPLADPPTDLAAATRALEKRLMAAVAARLPAAPAPVLVFLSGGVDSACLCALAAALAPGRVRALTVGFADPVADESAVAARIAAHLGVPHQVLRPTLAQLQDAFETLASAGEYPFADPAGPATLLAFQAARAQGEVALDGTGADTLLGVMPARHQRLAVAVMARLPAALRRAMAAAMAPLPRLRDYRPLVDFGDAPEVLVRWGGFTRREIARLCAEPVSLAHTRFYRLFARFPRAAHFERYSTLLGNLPDDRLHVAAALTGLDVRFPFFDPAVGALIEALPRDLRWRPEESKRVLKAVLARHLPRPLWEVPKHGFDAPFDALLAAQDYALVRTWLDPARVRQSGLLDPVAVAGLAARYQAGGRDERFRVWALVVWYAWLQCHAGGAALAPDRPPAPSP